jgi:hypothetical protein
MQGMMVGLLFLSGIVESAYDGLFGPRAVLKLDVPEPAPALLIGAQVFAVRLP